MSDERQTSRGSGGAHVRPGRIATAPVRLRRVTLALVALALLAAVGLGVGAWLLSGDDAGGAQGSRGSATGGLDLPGDGGAATSMPLSGASTFGYATTGGQVLGAEGTLRRFQVAVENGIDQQPDAFATTVDRVLADPHGWTAGKDVRFQRVAGTAASEFMIILASAGTAEKICAEGGFHTRQITSCRIPGKIVINLVRWLASTPGYGADLATYQAYAVNHELGHELGNGHETCPAPGQPAPVMQQQTLALAGCVANPWPYLDGKRHQGNPVP